MNRPNVSDQYVNIGPASIYVRRVHASLETPQSKRPPVVFLHDSLGCAETWRDFPRLLVEPLGRDAIVYDRQGYGRSSPFGSAPRTTRYLEDEARVLLRLLDTLGIDAAVLFGHSDGGSIALITGALAPSRVAAVVTEGAHVFLEDITLGGIRAAREELATTDLAARLARYHGDKTAGVTRAWIDTWLSPEFRSWNIEHYLSRIECPVLVIQGEQDEFGTVDQVNAIVDGTHARARAMIIPGIGHTPHRDAREIVLAATTDFILSTPRRVWPSV